MSWVLRLSIIIASIYFLDWSSTFQGYTQGYDTWSQFGTLAILPYWFGFFVGFFFEILFIYFSREGKEGRKRGGETSMWERNVSGLPLAHPQRGTRLQCRHVPWQGIGTVTWFAGGRPAHWATPVRAPYFLIFYCLLCLDLMSLISNDLFSR